mmetsp:Transcript_43517/g.87725  ORF Transcript_43517/g.87725 Transcript_43517/m.87725 type:complete len:238 (-) Transcript_43517:349-1062(-)
MDGLHLRGAQGAAPRERGGARGPELHGLADGVGGVAPVPREVLPQADHPGHGQPQVAALVPCLLRDEHVLVGHLCLLRGRCLRRYPRGLRNLGHGPGLHGRRGRHVVPQRLLGHGRCEAGEDQHGDRQRPRGQRPERLPGAGRAVGHPDLGDQGWPLPHGGERLAAGRVGVHDHAHARGLGLRRVQLFDAQVVRRLVPAHVRGLLGLRLGPADHELRDVAVPLLVGRMRWHVRRNPN